MARDESSYIWPRRTLVANAANHPAETHGHAWTRRAIFTSAAPARSLDHGVEPRVPDWKSCWSPLARRRPEVAEQLSSIVRSIEEGDLVRVVALHKSLVEGSEAVDRNGMSLLHHAAQHAGGDVEILEYLAGQALLNKKDVSGATPLHVAASIALKDIGTPSAAVAKLIQLGADVDSKDGDGRTPLHWAARIDQTSLVVAQLVQDGADLFARDQFGLTAMETALECGMERSVKVLARAREQHQLGSFGTWRKGLIERVAHENMQEATVLSALQRAISQREPSKFHWVAMQQDNWLQGACTLRDLQKYLDSTPADQRPWGLHSVQVSWAAKVRQAWLLISQGKDSAKYEDWESWWNQSLHRVNWDGGCAMEHTNGKENPFEMTEGAAQSDETAQEDEKAQDEAAAVQHLPAARRASSDYNSANFWSPSKNAFQLDEQDLI